jgi:hypothetical protein
MHKGGEHFLVEKNKKQSSCRQDVEGGHEHLPLESLMIFQPSRPQPVNPPKDYIAIERCSVDMSSDRYGVLPLLCLDFLKYFLFLNILK